MPELPEVETIARSLRESRGEYQPGILGCRIAAVDVRWARTLANLKPDQFSTRIAGKTVSTLSRRGKFLVFTLSPDTMLIHLRMSGDLRLESSAKPVQKHDRLLLTFGNGTRMAFNDTRKFGRVWLLEDVQEILGALGPEPLSDNFTPDSLYELLHAHSRQLKPLLMNQHFIAGLGNIYTDEALHTASLHPLSKSDTISKAETGRLHAAIQSVLTEGIRRNGASIDWAYKGGDFQNHFRVYGRTGEACPICASEIQRLVVGQRGTHICPNCQALKP